MKRGRSRSSHALSRLALVAAVSTAPSANGLAAAPRRMPPLQPSEHRGASSSSDSASDYQYTARKNHPTAYDEDPPFKGPLRLSEASSPEFHRVRIRRHLAYESDENDPRSLSSGASRQLKATASTETILKAIVDNLAYRDAPVDAKELAESIEFYLRTGKRLLGAAKRIANNENEGGSTSKPNNANGHITVCDLCSGHGLTGMLFAACNPPRTASAIPVRAVLVDQCEPPSHTVLREVIGEVCPWIGGDTVRFLPTTLEDFLEERTSTRNADSSGASIVISTHACGSLTDTVLSFGKESKAASIAVMPCCYTGTDRGTPYGIRRALGVALSADIRRSFSLEEGGYHVDW
eukprot:CAMPEP_0181047724 /NCGR_PEP_ID=MMETSP1070-20121207/15040_1 /TAXON_ID=265543 /ORGANISM="Minutocellus polymorphus, Strain NH13" /LENGTH=349 /DNA_ID=CAMNT_0023126431 /DNA_START=133 /DNA_END=1179 /DNA_ORIENTATION=-